MSSIGKRPPNPRQLARAQELGIGVHPRWGAAQVQAAINWASPDYRAKRAAGHARAMERIIRGDGFLYVAEVLGTDEIKIGHALDPERRMASIWSDHGKRCRLLRCMPAELSVERRLHRRLSRFLRRPLQGINLEFYPRSILSHDAIPEGLRL